MMRFGVACQECGRFVPLGKVDIAENAASSQLRAKLADQRFVGDWGDCEGCNAKTYCELDKAIVEYDGVKT